MVMPPDPDWYLDHVVVPSGPERAPVGPVRRRQAAWLALAAAPPDSGTPSGRAWALALRQGFVLTRRQCRRAGLTDAQVRGLLRRREWSSPRRGVVSPLPPRSRNSRADQDPSGDGPEVAAFAVALVRPGTAVSHASAAEAHGLPLLRRVARPTVTTPPGCRACSRDGVRVHAAQLDPADVERWFGAEVTAVARTVVDLGRSRGVAAAVVAADAALHEGLVSAAQLRAALARQTGWPGVRRARHAVELADGRAESPLESLARLVLVGSGLSPVPQVWVDVGSHRYRVDLMLAGRVVIEADGLDKYRAGFATVTKEKRRHERLERAGYIVVRVTWDDITKHPAETLARVRSALARRPLSAVP